MADQAVADEEQVAKRRALRGLAAALGLVGIAIVGFGVLQRYSETPKATPGSPGSEPPAIAALPPPKPIAPPANAPGAPATAEAPALPPPPPPAVQAHPELPARDPSKAAHPVAPADRSAAAEDAAPAATGTAAANGSAPPPAVAAGKPGPGFVVQLGMFTSVDNAVALQNRLREQGVPVFLETRVIVGPFRDRAEADAAQRKLKELGVAGVIAQRK